MNWLGHVRNTVYGVGMLLWKGCPPPKKVIFQKTVTWMKELKTLYENAQGNWRYFAFRKKKSLKTESPVFKHWECN